MAIKIKKSLLFASILCLSSFFVISQEVEQKRDLVLVLSDLQARYAVSFNYAEDVVANIQIVPPNSSLKLEDALKYLSDQTGLVFQLSDENLILIKPKEALLFCGYIKDKDTGLALESATITTLSNATTSDKNGFFQLRVQSELEEVTVSYIGYRTVTTSIQENNAKSCLDVFLSPQVEALSEVVLSNYIVNGITKINDGSYKIDFSNFDILPGLIETDVLQAVQAFPGIISSNETVSNINIRGGTHDQNLILWDDIKMYQSGHFFGLISMYNPQITENVSLLKNGTSAAYTDGVSGTISMNTEKKINTKTKGSIGLNLIDANGFTDISISDKSSLQIAARKSLSDIVQTPIYEAYFDRISQDTEVTNTANIENSDKTFDFYDMSLRFLYNISAKDELQLNFINVANELRFNENAVVDSEETSRQSSLKQNSIAAGLEYNRQWSKSFKTLLNIYETDYKLRAVNSNIIDSQRFLQENKISETSVRLAVENKLSDNISLTSGYHFVETEITNLDDVDVPLFRVLISEVVRTHGVFSQLNFRSSNTNFNFGLRYNYIDKFKKSILEPRLSFNQRINANLSFEVLAEFKHQNTSQIINFQNDFLGIEKRRWQLSNDNDIPVLRSRQISSGFYFSKKGWLISLDGYYKYVKGITSQSQGFQNQFEFERASGNYDVLGVDVLVRKQFKHFQTWMSYSYMDNTYEFESLASNSFPSNLDITHTVTFGAAYTDKRLKLSTGLNWRTGNPTTLPTQDNEVVNGSINFGNPNSSNLKDYLRLDVSALYNFNIAKNTNASLGLSVWNILDRNNEINNFYRVNENAAVETIQKSLGITPNLSFRVYF